MDDALRTLVTLLGGGGLTAIILGILGFLKGKGEQETEPGRGVMLAALYADQSTVQRMALALERHSDSLDRQTDAMKDNTDAFRERTREMRRP